MLTYRELPPDPRLQPNVQSLWILRHTGDSPEPQRVVPDGHPELILNFGAPFEAFQDGHWQPQPRCFLAGQIDAPLLLRPSGPAHILGIRFQPHGAAHLLGAPMHQLAGRFTPLDDLSPTLARAAAQSPDPQAFETALHTAAQASRFHDAPIAEAVRRISLSRGDTPLIPLARDLGLSLRQFERRFLAAVGLSPKLFCRMQRFVHVFRVLSDVPCSGNWVDAALASGYYDQSHLIRDFKQLAGDTPSALLAPDADLARHFLERFQMSHSSKTPRPAVR